MKKRGLSMVVATVLILLLTLVLAAILAQIVIPFVRDNLKQSTECVPYQNYFQFDSSFNYNCYELKGNKKEYKISVKTSAGDSSVEEGVAGFNLVVGSEGSSKVVLVKNGEAESCALGKVRNSESSCDSLGSLKVPGSGEARSYIYGTDEIVKYFEVGSILTSGRQCDTSDKIKQIPECNEGD